MSADFLPPDPKLVNVPQPTHTQSPFERPIDRMLIRIGELFTRYFAFIAFLAFFALVSIVLVVGGMFMVRDVGIRFNELEIKNQQKQIFLEQQLENAMMASESAEPEQSNKAIDESDWFVIVEDGQSAVTGSNVDDQTLSVVDDENKVEADGSQQFVETGNEVEEAPAEFSQPETDITVIN